MDEVGDGLGCWADFHAEALIFLSRAHPLLAVAPLLSCLSAPLIRFVFPMSSSNSLIHSLSLCQMIFLAASSHAMVEALHFYHSAHTRMLAHRMHIVNE